MPTSEPNKAPALVIMAKQPMVGQTKTRLSPPLDPVKATALYEAMLRDTIDLVAGFRGTQLAIAVTPPDAIEGFRAISPPKTILLPVSGTDIGDCLHQILGDLLAAGHPKVIALGSDSPTLPVAHLHQAIALLDQADMVLGPSEDGGYYLIGLRHPQPELFRGIPWSTENVTNQTVERAESLGLNVAFLPTWYDVDVVADLDRLRGELASLPDKSSPHTRRALQDLQI